MTATRLALAGMDLEAMFARAITPEPQKPPWESIIDFATHPDFCGNRLYPRQETLLKLAYLETDNLTQYDMDVIGDWGQRFTDPQYTTGVQPDILERAQWLRDHGYPHFRQILAVMGRRAGKGHLGGIIMAEQLARLVATDNPQAYYGIAEGHTVLSLTLATTYTQAQMFLFADLVSQVKSCAWLAPYVRVCEPHRIEISTPTDLRADAANPARGRKPAASLVALPASSNSAASRGGAVIGAGFDEFAFTREGESQYGAEALYNAITPAMDQFAQDALIYIPSSPYSRRGKLYDLYTQASRPMGEQAVPDTLIAQFESWEMYRDWEESPRILARGHRVGPVFKGAIQVEPDPEGTPQQRAMAALEEADPVTFRVERRGQFVESQYGFLREELVDSMFDDALGHRWAGPPNRDYYIHCDPAKNGADFAVMVAHVEPGAAGDGGPGLVVDGYRLYKPGASGEIDYRAVVADLKAVSDAFSTLREITFDQFNSVLPMQELRAYARQRGRRFTVVEQTFTAPYLQRMYSALRTALGLGMVASPTDDFGPGGACLLRAQLLGLEDINGKVVKSLEYKDDLVDCLATLVTRLLGERLSQVLGDLDAGTVFAPAGGVAVEGAPVAGVGRERGASLFGSGLFVR